MLAAQWNRHNYRDSNRQRLYLKDIDCPPLWQDKLKEQIPPSVFYLNDSVGETGGIGATEERYTNGVGSRLGRGIAKAGDLMSCMPASMRADNLMCYIGHEGTYTPAHREMCASLGQNIMVEASGQVGDDGKPTRPGSSIWFMTETKDRHLVSEYWLSSLGHDVEVEAHFASIDAWLKAPFKVWVVEQKVGDFVLIPPLAPHQVWNRGTRTMKVAWNRTTVETLEMAIKEALPRARMVCRDEQYKNKAIILFALNKYSGLLRSVERQKQTAPNDAASSRLANSSKIRQLEKDFRRLYSLFVEIMLSEALSPPLPRVEYVPYDSNITCSYCRCNIFNRFLTCKHCVVPLENGEEDTYDICMDCYAMGRSCRCLSKLTWVEQFPFRDLLEKYDLWRNQIVKLSGSSNRNPPLPLDHEKQRMGRKTLADVCQEQMSLRPFKDSKKDDVVANDNDDNEDDIEVNADGTVRKKAPKRSEKWYKEHPRCHICCHRHVRWKMALCSCGVAICYGSLWRGFDTLPQTVMQDLDWKCPKCQNICPCRDCQKIPENEPYEPKGTVLGHDTKKFADPRSVESLVDFSASNMHWIKKTGDNTPEGSRRLSRHADAAALERARDPALGEDYVQSRNDDDMVIDPLLAPVLDEDSGEEEQVGIQQAAADALSMMGGLSALEKDPQAFITQAGLNQNSYNDQSYEYPDPDESSSIIPTTENDDLTQTERKRKRNKDGPLVQSDAALSAANAKFQQQQANVRMKEARRKGHYISTQAALRGRSLVVRLPVDPAALARFAHQYPPEPVDIEPQASEEPMIVQSDLPKSVPDKVAKSRNPQVPKKRERSEKDDDFVANKREKRALGRTAGGRKLVSNASEDRMQSESDVDAEEDVEEELTYTPERRGSARMASSHRSLPSYLARRSPVNTTALPNELTGEAPERRKRKSNVTSNSINGDSILEPSTTAASMPVRTTLMATSNGTEADADLKGPAPEASHLSRKAPTAVMTRPEPELDLALSPSPSSTEATNSALPIPVDAYKEQKATPKPNPAPNAKTKPSPRRMSANIKAKLIASGAMDGSDSDSASDADLTASPAVSHVQSPASAKRGRGRPPKSSLGKKEATKPPTPNPPQPERKSIFSKSRGGKIKITSARALAKG